MARPTYGEVALESAAGEHTFPIGFTSSSAADAPVTEADAADSAEGPGAAIDGKGRKRRRRWFATVGIAALVAALLATGGVLLESSMAPVRNEYDAAFAGVERTIDNARILESRLPDFSPDTHSALNRAVLDADEFMESAIPHPLAFELERRLESLEAITGRLERAMKDRRSALQAYDEYHVAVIDADRVHGLAVDLLEETQGQVVDQTVWQALDDAAVELRGLLDTDVDSNDPADYEEATRAVETAEDTVTRRMPPVERSHEKWQEEQEAALERDPANYAAISDRDWQLLARDPDARAGERFVIYGRVTQADATLGTRTIRADTSGEHQASRYDYEINTVVWSNEEGLFGQIITGDIVRMQVRLEGSLTYDTTIGGTATAVLATAYTVEIMN